LCKHGDKEFYRVSKTMPVVPLDYTGLNTTLFDTYLLKIDEGTAEEENKEWSILRVAVIIGASTVGTILMCCIGYYICLYCANRSHRVTYMEPKTMTPKNKDNSKAKVSVKPISARSSEKKSVMQLGEVEKEVTHSG